MVELFDGSSQPGQRLIESLVSASRPAVGSSGYIQPAHGTQHADGQLAQLHKNLPGPVSFGVGLYTRAVHQLTYCFGLNRWPQHVEPTFTHDWHWDVC